MACPFTKKKKVVKFKKIHPDAKLPTRSYEEAAGLDLYAVEEYCIEPGEGVMVEVGLEIELPSGYCALMFTRSGDGFSGVRNHQGLIDSDYTGNISPYVWNHDKYIPKFIKVGDRVGQLFITPVIPFDVVETETLKKTERGKKGFGSSGR